MEKIKSFIKQIGKDKIDAHAAECAYFTILSFIPLLILIITLLKYFGLEENSVISVLNKIIPSNFMSEAVGNIIKEVSSKSIGTITISAIFTLWSAGKGFSALCKGLNVVFKKIEKKKFMYFRLRATIFTLIFIVIIVGVLFLMVFSSVLNNTLIDKFNIYNRVLNFLIKFKIIGITIFLFVIFLLMYKFIPKNDYKIKQLLIGAGFSAIGWTIVSYFFSIYVNLFKGFSIMYGSLTVLILFMMWFYACMYILLLGAEIIKLVAEGKENIL